MPKVEYLFEFAITTLEEGKRYDDYYKKLESEFSRDELLDIHYKDLRVIWNLAVYTVYTYKPRVIAEYESLVFSDIESSFKGVTADDKS